MRKLLVIEEIYLAVLMIKKNLLVNFGMKVIKNDAGFRFKP